VKPGFYISEGTTLIECTVKEIKLYGVAEIEYIEVILYSVKNAI
jgi:hypothetical protein